jgi:hypothetical protein
MAIFQGLMSVPQAETNPGSLVPPDHPRPPGSPAPAGWVIKTARSGPSWR